MTLKVIRTDVFVRDPAGALAHVLPLLRERKALAQERLRDERQPPPFDVDEELMWSEVEVCSSEADTEEEGFEDLEEAFATWNWDARPHDGGLLLADALDDFILEWQFQLFSWLAGFIPPDCAIEFEREDGYMQWYFDGKSCLKREASTTFKPILLDKKELAALGLAAEKETRVEALTLSLLSAFYNLRRLNTPEDEIDHHPVIVLIIAALARVARCAVRDSEKERQARMACLEVLK